MRYVNHKFGRACVHRPRREDRGKEGEKKEDERERERGHERVAKRYERARQRRTKGGLERGGEKGKSSRVRSLGAKECRGTKRESFSVVDESRSRVFLLINDRSSTARVAVNFLQIFSNRWKLKQTLQLLFLS